MNLKEELEDTKEVIRILKSKDRQHTATEKMTKRQTMQGSTKHYTEN
jgi:hypothetical protein